MNLRKPQDRSLPGSSWLVCLLLILGIWLAFGQAIHFDFVNYDDDFFVYHNSLVAEGLTLRGLVEVFTRMDRIFYYPLCVVSFMLDSTLYGLSPFGFHLTNVLLHMANAVLLFLVLKRMTGSVWRSAFTAAFFAIHPLQTEAVVWVTARKDVLSGFFFMLTLGAYCTYVKNPFSWMRYAAVFLLYLAGLLAKPMLVTLPFLMLLLDEWPLRRFSSFSRRVVLEKLPLIALSAGFCVITLMTAAENTGEVTQGVSFLWRIGNALTSYVLYLRQMIFPSGLALPYPARQISPAESGAAFLFLAAVSAAALLLRKKRPYLLTGWFWYLGMLIPVLGVIRVLGTARADRFTYLPRIGLCLLLVWTLADWCHSARRRAGMSLFAGLILVGLTAASRIQTGYWRDSETLWRNALKHTEGNSVAHSNLGAALFVKGRTDEAIQQFEEAIRLGTRQAEVFNNLGLSLADAGRYSEAIAFYMKALEIDPERAEIIINFADTLAALGDTERAFRLYKLALTIQPRNSDVILKLSRLTESGGEPVPGQE